MLDTRYICILCKMVYFDLTLLSVVKGGLRIDQVSVHSSSCSMMSVWNTRHPSYPPRKTNLKEVSDDLRLMRCYISKPEVSSRASSLLAN